jgi:hypothetical protein
MITPDELFNCCTNGTAPDWSNYAELVLEGCRDISRNPDEGTEISGGFDRHEAEFFGVYAISHEGYADAITDVHGTMAAAEDIMHHLSGLSGLPARRHEVL